MHRHDSSVRSEKDFVQPFRLTGLSGKAEQSSLQEAAQLYTETKRQGTTDSKMDESSLLLSHRSDFSTEQVDRSRPKKRNNQWQKVSEKLKSIMEEQNFEKFVDSHQFESLQETLIQII